MYICLSFSMYYTASSLCVVLNGEPSDAKDTHHKQSNLTISPNSLPVDPETITLLFDSCTVCIAHYRCKRECFSLDNDKGSFISQAFIQMGKHCRTFKRS